jgi:hypothetical protein
MGEIPLPHVFENTLVGADGWDSHPEIMNPSMESVDKIINDREEMLQENKGEGGDGSQQMWFMRDLNGEQFQGMLSIWTEVGWPHSPRDVTVLSFLNSDIVYFIDKGTLFDKSAVKNIVVRFLDGENILESLPFEAKTRDEASKSPKLRYCFIDEESAKLKTKI